MLIRKNRDFSCTFWIIQIYFSDSGRFLCVSAYFIYLFFQIIVNKKHSKQNQKKPWNLQNAFSLRTIKVCRFEIIDGVKYVYCIKHAYKSSEGTSRVCSRSLTLASMCFLWVIHVWILMNCSCSKHQQHWKGKLIKTYTINVLNWMSRHAEFLSYFIVFYRTLKQLCPYLPVPDTHCLQCV